MTALQILGALLLGVVATAGVVVVMWHLWDQDRDDGQPVEHHHCRIVRTPYDWAEDDT